MTGTAPTLAEILAPGFLGTVFQPVVRLSGDRVEIDSVEALVRGPAASLFNSAGLLCDFVRRKRAEVEFDRACIRTALSQAPSLPPDIRVSVNVHAATLHHDAEFGDFLRHTAKENGIAASRLTVEIVEHAPNWAKYRLGTALEGLRRDGVRIALDDIGLGQASFRMILDVKPDRFKVDRYFVQGCATDPYRQAVLSAIVGLSAPFGAQVVAEGVEKANDLAAARAVGIDRFQAYLFFPPMMASEIAAAARPPVEAAPLRRPEASFHAEKRSR